MSHETLPSSLGTDLRSVVGTEGLITDPARLLVYESDGLTAYRFPPRAVVLPGTTDELVAVLQALARTGLPVVPRGAGTGLSGGALASEGAVVVGTARLNRILELDADNRRARVQPGVINAHLTRAARPRGLFYAPDPSSQSACTIGGNVAENSGGPHCLKYGVTSRYVTGVRVVLGSGEVVELGGRARHSGPLDLVGVFVGSEGCFGVAAEIEVELLPLPQDVRTLLAIFDRLEDAGHAVTSIISRGLLPAALEIIDGATIQAVEASIFAAGYPTDAGAALVIEFEGLAAGLDREAEAAAACCRGAGAREVRGAASEEERAALWKGRKKAFGAMGRIAPDLLVQDATVPRTRLPDVLARIDEIGRGYDLKLANVFHAGDGNLHPNILFDRRDADELARVEKASREIMQVCVDAGGTITGEHGVGVDKRKYMPLILSPVTLKAMADVRRVFDPGARVNPGKVLPDDFWPPGREASSGDSGGDGSDGRQEGHGPGAPGPDGEVTPGSTGEVASLLRRASSEGLPVKVTGGIGNGASGPGPASSGARLTLDTRKLTEVLDHRPADLTVTVGAGVTLGHLDGVVKAAGQWLPLDPGGWKERTVGAILARGAAGPLQAAYGTPRDHVLGLTLVSGDGRVLELGGRVVKNVAGYDLVRLATGSCGLLGVITEATFRLHPTPEADTALLFRGGSAEELTALARALATAPLMVAALELTEPGAESENQAELAVRLLGSGEAVEAGVALLLGAAERDPDERLEGDRVQEHFDAADREEAAMPLVLELALLPDRLDTLVELARRLAAAAGTSDPRLAARASRGRLRVALRAGAEDADLWRPPLDEVRDRVESLGGSLTLVRTPWPRASGPPGSAPSGVEERLVRGLARAFDPAGILSGGTT